MAHENEQYLRFRSILHKFIRPSLKELIRYDRETLKKNYLKESPGIKDALKRKYFYQNSEEMNDLICLLDRGNRLKIGKILCDLTNDDLKVSFQNFGVSYSGRIIGRLLNYGEDKYLNNERILEIGAICIILDFPFEASFEVCNKEAITSFLEYEIFRNKVVKMEDLIPKLTISINEAKSHLKRYTVPNVVVDAYFLEVYKLPVKLHYHRAGFFEIHFFIINPQEIIKFLKLFSVFHPQYFFYAPTVLRGNLKKICVLCTEKPTSLEFKSFKERVESLVVLNEINPNKGF